MGKCMYMPSSGSCGGKDSAVVFFKLTDYTTPSSILNVIEGKRPIDESERFLKDVNEALNAGKMVAVEIGDLIGYMTGLNRTDGRLNLCCVTYNGGFYAYLLYETENGVMIAVYNA